jgi:hypothetical protein
MHANARTHARTHPRVECIECGLTIAYGRVAKQVLASHARVCHTHLRGLDHLPKSLRQELKRLAVLAAVALRMPRAVQRSAAQRDCTKLISGRRVRRELTDYVNE